MQCARCKGKGMCGLPRCPIVSRFHAQVAVKPTSSYLGSSPSVFIGSFGYPDMHGGPLLINDSDNPPDWLAHNLGMEDIVGIRARTIRGNSALHAVSDNLQEIALSTIPIDVDVAFEKPVTFSLSFDGTVAPVGFTGSVKKMDVLGNARVERVVDRITSDTDIVATDACVALSDSAIDVYQISKLMTAGLLGKRRKFVPTRWAITAVDDTLSMHLKKEIARYPPIEEIRLFTGEIFGNRIVGILVPGDWKFEMIEVWGKQTLWAGDEEVIVIRSISGDYWAPLGTWVIREATRKAMHNPPVICESLDSAVRQASIILGSGTWALHSTLISELRTQRTLFHF
jgi:hypothetical protein